MAEAIESKFCSICKQTKPLTDFYRNKFRADGRYSQCAACVHRNKDRTCAVCGKKFHAFPSQPNKLHCSQSCGAKGRKRPPLPLNCTCQVCGKKFHRRAYYITAGMGKYCSVPCKAKGQSYGGIDNPAPEPNRVCEICSTPFYRRPSIIEQTGQRFCSSRCHGEAIRQRVEREGHKRKPTFDRWGYVRVWKPNHHRANTAGYVLEHILVAEEYYDAKIGRHLHVHHINGIKNDNRPENLAVLTEAQHLSLHSRGRPRPSRQTRYKKICPQCGREYETIPTRDKKFCSRECYGLSRRGTKRTEETKRKMSEARSRWHQWQQRKNYWPSDS